MKCPVRARLFVRGADTHIESTMDCLKEECAWWNSQEEECALITVGKTLSILADHIANIEVKLPF